MSKRDLVDLLLQLPKPTLLVGDFNIRHPSRGYTVSSPSAPMILSVNSDFSLTCLNSGYPTHYHRSTDSLSCIHLSFCSSSAILDFSWSIETFHHGSDHYPILLTETHPSSPPAPVCFWNFNRADWTTFAEPTGIVSYPTAFQSTDSVLDHFNATINEATNCTIPLITHSGKSLLSCWSPEYSVVSHRKNPTYHRRL